MRNRHKTIAGRNYDLSRLSSEEHQFLDEIFEVFSTEPPVTQFMNTWLSRGVETIWETGDYIGSPVYRICQDLQARLGIAQNRLSPPDYRDQIAALIEEHFPSRYKFCKEIGIDEGHLSRVLAGKKEFALETFLKILRALKVEIELAPLKHGSDYLELDNPVAELAELDRRAKWLRRRRKELGEPDRKNDSASTPARSSHFSPPEYFPDDIAALDSIDAVTQTLKETLIEMAELSRRITLRAEDEIEMQKRDGGKYALSAVARVSNELPKQAKEVIAEADSLGSLANQPNPIRRFQHLYTELQRNTGRINRRLPSGLLNHSTGCAYLIFLTDESASKAFISELANQLQGRPSIVAAGLLDYWWAALDISSIRGVVDQVAKLADREGVKFFSSRDEYQRFRRSQLKGALPPRSQTQMLERWMRERCVIRYMVKPSYVLDPILSRITQSPELRAAGLSLSLMHASIFDRGFVDFFVLDRNQKPVSDPDQLRMLFTPKFYLQFGVVKPDQLHNWSEFIHLGLEQDVRLVVERSLTKGHSKSVSEKRLTNAVRQFLDNYPLMIAGITEEGEGQTGHTDSKSVISEREDSIGRRQEESSTLIVGFEEGVAA